MRRPIVALAAGLLAVSTTAGCTTWHTITAKHPDPRPTAVTHRKPVPPAALRSLPDGVFYLLAGPDPRDMNVWEVSSAGVEKQLTDNPPGYEIDGMAAAVPGIVVSDSLQGIDQLASLTGQGPAWLQTARQPGQLIPGEAPDIRPDGGITYVLPPYDGRGGSPDYTVWVRRSFTGTQRMVFRDRVSPGASFLGPDGEVAVVGPAGQLPAGRHPAIEMISPDGEISRIPTPLLGTSDAWGARAPALVVSTLNGPALALYPGGLRQSLPDGWQPLAWNPAGSGLLVVTGRQLGIWSPAHPRVVTAAGTLTPGVSVVQASWLGQPAHL